MTILDSIKALFKPRESEPDAVIKYDALIFDQKTGRRAAIITDTPISEESFIRIKEQIDEALEKGTPVILDSNFEVVLMEPDRTYAIIPNRELTDDEFYKLKQAIDDIYTGPRNANRPIVLEGMKVVPLS